MEDKNTSTQSILGLDDLELTNAMTPDKKPTQDYCRTGMSLEEIQQNKVDARLYSALKHIIQSNLFIPHNLISKPDDEYQIDYQSRLKVAQMITSEFKKLTGKDIKDL